MNSSEETRGSGAPQAGAVSSGSETYSPMSALARVRRRLTGGGGSVPPEPPDGGEPDEDDEGMVRMSFLDHLAELRKRILASLIGAAVAFAGSLLFSEQLWKIVAQPAVGALKTLGYEQTLVQIEPMESFNVIWFKLPLLCA